MIDLRSQVLPFAKFASAAHVLGDLEAGDDAPFDLLAGLFGGVARPTDTPSLIEVRGKSVALDGCLSKLGQ